VSRRLEKVNSQIKKEIMQIIQKEVDDPCMELVSITKVKTTPDLKEAHIYFSVFREEDTEKVLKILNRMRNYLRRLLGKRMRIKVLPSLKFSPDDSIRYSVEIYKKIEEVMGDKEDNSDYKRK